MKNRMTNFGFSTILIGFTMICIVIFSALALITANSDYKLSKKVADKNTTYYEAEKEAYSTIEAIDKQLYEIYSSTNSKEEYFDQIYTSLVVNTGKLETSPDGKISYSFEISLSTNQTLEVSIAICYPTSTTDTFYQIQKWQTKTDTSIDEEDTLNLIGT